MTSRDPLDTYNETGLFTRHGLIEVPAMLTAHYNLRRWLKYPVDHPFGPGKPNTYSYVVAEQQALLLGIVVTEVDADPNKDVPPYKDVWYSIRATAPSLDTYRQDQSLITRIALSVTPLHGREEAFDRLAEEGERSYSGLDVADAPAISHIVTCANCGEGGFVSHIDALPIDSPFSDETHRTNAELFHHVDPAFPDHPSICGIKAEGVVHHLTPETTKEDLVCRHCDEQVDIVVIPGPEVSVNEIGFSQPTRIFGQDRHVTYHVKSGSPYCYGKRRPS
jgi:hypothetical protein